jgi:hypothetical protein
MRVSRLPSLLFAFTFAGCASAPPDPPAGCNPLVGDDCMSPFPSSFYEVADTSTATGVRVSIAPGVLPVSKSSVPFSPDPLNLRDGFSPATPFVVYFAAGVDGSRLPGDGDLAASVTPQSTVQLIELATGQRLPVMAELDAGAVPSVGDRQALIVRPMVRLKNGTRYLIALVGLTDASGHDVTPAPFRALRDRGALSKSLQPLAARTEEILAALAAAGVPRSSVTLAWDVVTASDAQATSNLVKMRDRAFELVSAGKLGYAVTAVNDTPMHPHLWRELTGTFQVPSFLTDDSSTATLQIDPKGQPGLRAISQAKFVVHVPQCAKRGNAPLPLPVLVFGHGLFSDAQDELGTEYQKQIGDRLCMVQIGTNWIGLSKDDIPAITNHVLSDLNQIGIVTDRLQQAHVNAQVLTRLFLTTIKNDPQLRVDGRPITDGSQVYYYGISDGGIQGGTFMALSPDVVRGVLNVPGCEWSLMMLRSHDFAALQPLLGSVYTDALDQQVLVTALQSEWDQTDPASFATHLVADPLPSVPLKHILVQEAIGDAQVPNLATRVLVRTLGLPGLDLEQPVFGVSQAAAPLDSAYTQWDIHPTPLPMDADVPPSSDNGAHESIRALEPLEQQLQSFFKPDGQVQSTCKGPCSF